MEKIAIILAIIATALSVVLALIRLYDFYKEKNNIKIKLRANALIVDGSEISKENTYIMISIINVGEEAVTIISAGLLSPELEKRSSYLFKVKTKKLHTSDSIDYLDLEKNVKKEFDISKRKYVAYALDNAGRLYFSHNFIKRLIRLKRFG